VQCLFRYIKNLGFQQKYANDFEFRLWFKQFTALALIPLEKLEQAFTIIIENGGQYLNDVNMQRFISYFIEQWLNGNISPEIWNHFQSGQRRTNNDVEGKFTHFFNCLVNPN
jgi:hypothetical protein